MSYRLTYDLRAETPMIHFQAEQPGATLRATEVKPKLDKFILRKLGRENVPKDWFISDTEALNYKLRFRAQGEGRPMTPHKMFFGNAGKNPGERDYTMSMQCDCQMQVLCFIPQLRDKIAELVEEFFICTNFGRMQNKGFGSFVIIDPQNKRLPDKATIGRVLCESTGAKVCYCFGDGKQSTENIFNDIQLLYTVMKSGFNRMDHMRPRSEQYHRSYLFEYFHEENVGNEKAAMKRESVSPAVRHPENKRQIAEQNFEEYHYVRALLGIADHIEYITGFAPYTDERGNSLWRPVRNKETVKISCDDIRFASPIFFKVIDGFVYIAANRIDKEILGKEFKFENAVTKKSMKLTVPEKFDIDGFMKWFVNKYSEDTKNISPEVRKSYRIKTKIKVAYEVRGGSTNV